MKPDLIEYGKAQVNAYRLIRQTVTQTVRNHGLGSVSEWFLLNLIHNGRDVQPRDLAASLDGDAPLVTRLVQDLARRRLVIATPHSSRQTKQVHKYHPSDGVVTRTY